MLSSNRGAQTVASMFCQEQELPVQQVLVEPQLPPQQVLEPHTVEGRWRLPVGSGFVTLPTML